MVWKVSEIAKMTDGVGFTIQQPGKAEIVAFVFKDELTAARHARALENAMTDIVTITLHCDPGCADAHPAASL
jgi:hypothetical protein